jgi:PHP-associated
VSGRHFVIGGALIAALAAGTTRDRAPSASRVMLNGYHVLAVDFHVHTHPLSTSTLAPWDVVAEARRVHLDAIAVTPHNHVWPAKVARWISRLEDGPIVLVGEEIAVVRGHLLVVGIERAIARGRSAAVTIDEAHAQGGIAIAAHPIAQYWPGYGADAIARLDGSEIVHPVVYECDTCADELRAFNARGPLTAIGDTDAHGIGRFGVARTYVFARERTAASILEAVRAGRTVVYDRGRAYGDATLVRIAANDGRLPRMAAADGPRRLGTIDGAIGIIALLAAVLFGFRADSADPRA